MKIKNLTKRALAFALVCITIAGSTPAVDVHAEDTSNSKVDIYATQSSDYLITIPKQLILDGKNGSGAYRVSVKGNISGTDIITVTPDSRFFMKQEGKTDILTNIEQIKTQFTYADGVRPEVEVTADGKVQMEKISAGKWTGLFNFNITSSVDLESEDSVGSTIDDIKGNGTGKDTAQDKNSEYSVIDTFGSVSTDIKVSAKNEDGEDINATASTIVGTEAKELLDGLKETGYIEDTEEVDALIEVESDDFDGLAETTFDVSSIAKPGDEVIILHFDEEKQMWEFIGQETVGEDGTVKGDFTSYSPVAFVKVEKGEIKPHFHNFITESMVDATCTTEGLITYVCDECDHKTDVTLDPLGHNPISSITPPSCTEGGYTTYVCSRCGEEYQDDSVDATGHSYGEWVIVKEATCTENGSKQKTCSACNDVVTEDIAALGHDYKTSSTASSCTEEGYTTYTCNTCGHSYTDDKVPALGHSYGEWVTVKEATCTETGSKQKTCSACNDIVTENIAVLGHDYKTSSTAPSCTEEGYTTYTCNTCGHSYTDNKVSALGHSYGEWVIVKEATCTEAGSKQKTCSACNDVVTEDIAALGHDYKTSSTASSCTEEGYTTYTCNTCGYSYTDDKVPALGHSYGNYVTTTEATCTVDGVKTKTCTVCGNKETAVITKLGHNYSTTYTIDKEATCTTAGSKSQHCSRCTSTQNVTSIPALGHSYGTPTYTWTGYTACKASRTCTRCNNVETENGTITNAVTTTATCTATGIRTYTAKFSNTAFSTQTKTETIAKNSSNHTGSVVNGGTSGVHTKYSCCGATVISTHSYTVDSGVQYKAATCTSKRQNYKSCSCGYNPKSASYVVETGSVNSSNHTGTVVNGGTSGVHTKYSCCGATVISTHSYTVDSGVQYKAATCTSKRQNYKSCSCGYNPKSASYVVETGSVNSSNHTGTVVNGGTSGVHTKYSCCGATVSTIHSYTNKVTTAATCTTAGVRTYTCECGYSYTSTITAPGHSYSSYSTSSTQHWKACTNGCGTKTSVGNHADGGTDGLCDTCGYKGTIVYVYHTHTNSSNCEVWSDTRSCQVCGGTGGKTTCSTCGGDKQVTTYFNYACTGTIRHLGSDSRVITCTSCNSSYTVGGGAYGCDTCGNQISYGYRSACACSPSSYPQDIPSICGATSKTEACTNCTDGYNYCYLCKGSNSNLTYKTCPSCNGKTTIASTYACGGKISVVSSSGGPCSSCGYGNFYSETGQCSTCKTYYYAGGGGCKCGGGPTTYLPTSCTAKIKDCPTCTNGKVYKVKDCGKTTSSIESQYTKFE